MIRHIEKQTRAIWEASQALRYGDDTAGRTLSKLSQQGASVKVRLAAINAMRRAGMMVPVNTTFGGDAA